MVAPANDLLTNATPVVISTNGGTFTAASTLNTELTTGADDPPQYPSKQRTAWWRYQPAVAGAFTMYPAVSSQQQYVFAYIYKADATETTFTAVARTQAGGFVNVNVAANDVYLIAMGVSDFDIPGLTYDFDLSGPQSAAPVSHDPITAAVPVVDATIEIPAPAAAIGGGGALTVDVPPLDLVAEAPAPAIPAASALTLDASPITAGVTIIPADLRRILYGIIDPPDVTVLPVTAPTLTGYVNLFEGDADDPGYIVAEFEYGIGTDDDYLRLGTVTEPVEIYTSYSLAEATLPALPAGDNIYYWRMRIIVDGMARNWTVWWSFKVGGTNEATLPVTATITGAARYPHLWFIDPPVGAPGETVTLVGQGFADDETGVTFGSQTVQVVTWERKAATTAAGTADRQITAGLIDPAHDEVQVIIPDTEEPGSSVTVLGEDD